MILYKIMNSEYLENIEQKNKNLGWIGEEDSKLISNSWTGNG